jgi:hypothetical protein
MPAGIGEHNLTKKSAVCHQAWETVCMPTKMTKSISYNYHVEICGVHLYLLDSMPTLEETSEMGKSTSGLAPFPFVYI